MKMLAVFRLRIRNRFSAKNSCRFSASNKETLHRPYPGSTGLAEKRLRIRNRKTAKLFAKSVCGLPKNGYGFVTEKRQTWLRIGGGRPRHSATRKGSPWTPYAQPDPLSTPSAAHRKHAADRQAREAMFVALVQPGCVCARPRAQHGRGPTLVAVPRVRDATPRRIPRTFVRAGARTRAIDSALQLFFREYIQHVLGLCVPIGCFIFLQKNGYGILAVFRQTNL